MLALVFDGEPIVRDDWPRPVLGPGDALLAVRLAGVCRTDLEIVRGYMGFTGVMGHEFVGEVLEGPTPWPGRRVVAEINCPCGCCALCAAGLGNHCRGRTVVGIDGRDGAFAQLLAVPVANLHAVPPALRDEQAVFAEPLAAAFQVLCQVDVRPGDRAVVLGDGRLGQLVARVLRGRCGELLLVGRHEAKLALAERQGIRTCLAADFAPDASADLVVDATGTPAGLAAALGAVRPRGTVVLKSTFAGSPPLNLAPVVIHEITLVGSRCGPVDRALEALAAGEVQVEDLITARFPLRDGLAALAAAGSGEHLKVLIDVR